MTERKLGIADAKNFFMNVKERLRRVHELVKCWESKVSEYSTAFFENPYDPKLDKLRDNAMEAYRDLEKEIYTDLVLTGRDWLKILKPPIHQSPYAYWTVRIGEGENEEDYEIIFEQDHLNPNEKYRFIWWTDGTPILYPVHKHIPWIHTAGRIEDGPTDRSSR